jgi:hypothetical protein
MMVCAAATPALAVNADAASSETSQCFVDAILSLLA